MAVSQQMSSVNKHTAEFKMDSVTYKWTIRNFSQYMKKKVGFSLKSKTFSYEACKAEEKIKWHLKIYPNGARKEYINSISLFLCPEVNAKFELTVQYTFFILNGRLEPSYENEISYKFISPCNGHGCSFVTTETLLERAKEFLPNDSLTVYCKIIHSPDTHENDAVKAIPKRCLGDNLSDLFKKQWLCDVTLTAQGEEFKAHKIILAARSKVFAAMFFSDMKEKTQNVIEIVDMDKEVLRNLLHYIYCEQEPVEKSVPVLSGLLTAADKYDLERLKILCEKDLSLKLTVDNVVELLILADLHNASELKSFALDFVNSELDEVMKTEVWMIFVRNHPCLLNEVLAYHLKCDREDMEN